MLDTNKIDDMYRCYRILKRKGYYQHLENGNRVWVPPKYRNITAPSDELKSEQRKILKETLSKININDRASGFVKDKDIRDNAKEHIGAKWILEVDLKDFFDSITREQVKTSLINNRINSDLAEYISKICTRYGITPQGAPTSPMISNIVCKPLDRKIKELAIKNNCIYTRYADDITISSKDKENGYLILQNIKPKLESLIQLSGFKINKSKTKVVGEHRKQSVTGIVINSSTEENTKLYPPKKERQIFRATLHNILRDINKGEINSFKELEEKYRSYDKLQGYANFLYQVNPEQCSKYLNQVKLIHAMLRK